MPSVMDTLDKIPGIDKIPGFKKKDDEADALEGGFDKYPHLIALKPKERYLFRSDYWEVDQRVACILSYFHDDEAKDGYKPFWGINLIPRSLGDDITTVITQQVRRKGEGWIEDQQKKSDQLDRMNEREQNETGSNRSRSANRKVTNDLIKVAMELQDGAAYLHVQTKLYIEAPNIDALDEAIEAVKRQYVDQFGTLRAAPYAGEQRDELSKLWAKNEKKRGKGFYFTSPEFAGSYNLVTNGLNDPTGEYVGIMVGDVNNSAVQFDVNKYEHHAVVASNRQHLTGGVNRAFVADMWGSKISQSAMLNNQRVVHLVLNGANLDDMGPKFSNMTHKVDLNTGDVNMFEIFGDRKDQLTLFPAHIEKLVLMAEQMFEASGAEGTITSGNLAQILTTFYVDKRMWYRNAVENKDRLRVAGIPHNQVPLLYEFATYLDTRYRAIQNADKYDQDELRAINVLRLVFQNMLDNNGDLFNQHTSSRIDGAREGSRVIYDFSTLMRRGEGVAMAQLVNVVGFAVESLGRGDVVIIHGAENIVDAHGKNNIENRVKTYITRQFEHLHRRGGRVVYLYNNIDAMLKDREFNAFDGADYTILGTMRESTLSVYKQELHQALAPGLEGLLTMREDPHVYLRRGHNNIVFWPDFPLGINKNRTYKRREMMLSKQMQEMQNSGLLSQDNDFSVSKQNEADNKKDQAASAARRRRQLGTQSKIKKAQSRVNTSGATKASQQVSDASSGSIGLNKTNSTRGEVKAMSGSSRLGK